MTDFENRLNERRLWDPVTFEVSKWATNLLRLKITAGSPQQDNDMRIIGAFVYASGRTTSHKEDEVTILALLAGMKPTKITALLDDPDSASKENRTAERTVKFLSALGKIPRQVLLADGPRCP